MIIPFYDLKSINNEFLSDFQSGAESVFKTGQVLNGENLSNFEKNFAKFQNVEHCVGVANGLDAIILTLKALDIGPGDEVIVPAFTFIATWFAVSLVGATVVPIDVNENALIDPRLIRKVITNKTKAILTVNLFGQMSDIFELRKIADEFGLFLIEDSAQAHGAEIDGYRAGQKSDAATFSFYPTKNLGALGDAGAVITNNKQLASKIREIANYGSSQKYIHDSIGVNSRMDEIQAFFLNKKLMCLESDNKKRRKIAKRYMEACSSSNLKFIKQTEESAFHLFITLPRVRSDFKNYLENLGISTLIHYPQIPADSGAYRATFGNSDFKVSRDLSESVLSLPFWPSMSEAQIEYLCSALTNYQPTNSSL